VRLAHHAEHLREVADLHAVTDSPNVVHDEAHFIAGAPAEVLAKSYGEKMNSPIVTGRSKACVSPIRPSMSLVVWVLVGNVAQLVQSAADLDSLVAGIATHAVEQKSVIVAGALADGLCDLDVQFIVHRVVGEPWRMDLVGREPVPLACSRSATKSSTVFRCWELA